MAHGYGLRHELDTEVGRGQSERFTIDIEGFEFVPLQPIRPIVGHGIRFGQEKDQPRLSESNRYLARGRLTFTGRRVPKLGSAKLHLGM